MAQLIRRNVPGHWSDRNSECVTVGQNGRTLPNTEQCADYDEHYQRIMVSLSHLQAEDRIWSIGMGDGEAHYYIYSEKPLRLVLLEDFEYVAHYATIRGLRLSDIETQRDFHRRYRAAGYM